MNLIDRAKNILLTPKTEWEVVATETTPVASIVTGYVLPLAGVAAIAHFISMCVIGTITPLGTFRLGMGWGLAMMVYQFVMSIVSVFVAAAIIDFLAPTFGATKGFDRAFRVAAYTYTAAWIGGVFGIIPWLGMLLALLLALYAIYLLYLGLPRVMGNPPDKSPGYTALVIVVAIVVGIVIAMVGGLISGPAMMAGMAANAPAVTYDKNSRLGKLEEFGKKMEEANKKMEAASKSGDPQKQMAAAMGALGTAMSGGAGVEPVQLDALRPLLPETVAGLPRTSSRADRSGVAGLMAAKVAGVYGDNSGKRIELEVVDTGGAAGLTALAGLAAMGESETDSRIERTRKEGDRLVREEISKRGGTNSYTVILKDRFVVSGKGKGVGIDEVKSAVNGLDLGKVESLK